MCTQLIVHNRAEDIVHFAVTVHASPILGSRRTECRCCCISGSYGGMTRSRSTDDIHTFLARAKISRLSPVETCNARWTDFGCVLTQTLVAEIFRDDPQNGAPQVPQVNSDFGVIPESLHRLEAVNTFHSYSLAVVWSLLGARAVPPADWLADFDILEARVTPSSPPIDGPTTRNPVEIRFRT